MPPMFETRKMKKMTVCLTRVRSRLVWRSARIRSIDAPVAPMHDASREPGTRNAECTTGGGARHGLESPGTGDGGPPSVAACARLPGGGARDIKCLSIGAGFPRGERSDQGHRRARRVL